MHIGIAGPIYIPSLNIKYDGDKSNWPKGMGGVPVNHLINALLELGYKVSVFSSTPEIAVGESFEWHEENLSIYLGPHRSKPRYTCLDFFAVESNYIKNAILKAQPDFVHAHWQYEWALGALKSGMKTLITCHDSSVHVFKAQPDLYRFYRLIMSFIVITRAKYLTTVSESCEKGLKMLTSKKMTVIPNFEPDEVFSFFKNDRTIDKKISIAMINNGFTKLKNVSIGIIAFQKLREQYPDVELHLFGKSFAIDEEAYSWCIKNLSHENIRFRGELNFEVLMNELEKMDIFLHTSIEESFGMVLVEAMAMGIPVVAGKNSGGPEWILRDGGGILVDIRKVDEIKMSLEILMQPKTYQEVSLKAREIAMNNFSKEIVVKKYLAEYQKMLNK